MWGDVDAPQPAPGAGLRVGTAQTTRVGKPFRGPGLRIQSLLNVYFRVFVSSSVVVMVHSDLFEILMISHQTHHTNTSTENNTLSSEIDRLFRIFI